MPSLSRGCYVTVLLPAALGRTCTRVGGQLAARRALARGRSVVVVLRQRWAATEVARVAAFTDTRATVARVAAVVTQKVAAVARPKYSVCSVQVWTVKVAKRPKPASTWLPMLFNLDPGW